MKNIKLNVLPVYDDRYVKTYGVNVYTNFRGLNVPQDAIECEYLQSFLLILYFYMKTNIVCKYI